MINVCKHCQKQFKAKPSHRRDFCCCKCRSDHAYATDPRYSSRQCEVCGITFKPKYGSGGDARSACRYCSHQCRNAGFGRMLSKEKVVRKCKQCGKEMKVAPYRAETFQFCSFSCRSQWWGPIHAAKRFPVKHRRPREDCDYYRTAGWMKWAAKIRKRDNYTCQHCGKQFNPIRRGLHVHHIVPRRNGGTDDPSNLISLCLVCHTKEDARIQKEDVENGCFTRKQRSDAGVPDRRRSRLGSLQPNAKLKESDIPEIMKLAHEGMSAPKIAKRFNVTSSAIYRIMHGDGWKHLDVNVIPKGIQTKGRIRDPEHCARISRGRREMFARRKAEAARLKAEQRAQATFLRTGIKPAAPENPKRETQGKLFD